MISIDACRGGKFIANTLDCVVECKFYVYGVHNREMISLYEREQCRMQKGGCSVMPTVII